MLSAKQSKNTRSQGSRPGNGKGSNQKSKKQNPNNSRKGASQVYPVVFAPIAKASGTKTGNANIRVDGIRTVIRHRELVDTIVSGPAINGWAIVSRLRINAASAKTFPWLSRLAINFETYKFRRLSFNFLTRAAANTGGSVMLIPDYDAADGGVNLITESLASSNADSVENVVWNNNACHFKPERLNATYKQHFCMSDPRFAKTTQDEKTIDAGQFFTSVEYSFANSPVGKLWVDYEVELCTPQGATEDPQYGGPKYTINVDPNTVTPVTGIQTAADEAEPILTPKSSGFPQSGYATFNRDWTGTISSYFTGTGLNPAVSSDFKPQLNGVPLASGFWNTPNVLNTAATQLSNMFELSANKGDVLGFGNLPATTLTQAYQTLGGSGVFL